MKASESVQTYYPTWPNAADMRAACRTPVYDWIAPLAVLALVIAGVACSTQEQAVEASWHFTDISAEAGLWDFRHVNGAEGAWYMPETMGSGAAFLDYNRDGAVDLAVVGGAYWSGESPPAVRLFAGDGRGAFSEVTQSSGLGDLNRYGMGLIAGDIDADGDDDLFLTAMGRNALLVNEEGVFADRTADAGLDTSEEWNVAALFVDANRDGWLDLYVTGYVNWTPESDQFCTPDGQQKRYCTPELYAGIAGLYFQNTGHGNFVERTRASGLGGGGKTLGAITTDINRDQWPDIVLANDTDPDQLFVNRGDGTFDEIGLASGMALDPQGRARAGMGIDAGVVDSTGEPTLFVGHFENEMTGVFQYSPAGYFVDRSAASGIGAASLRALSFGTLLLDADLDGDLDLLVVNGHINPDAKERSDIARYRQPAQLFVNHGQGRFSDRAGELGLATPVVGRGAATADIDADGDLDILVTANNDRVRLYRNDLPGGTRWIRLRLQGRRVDAEVEITTGDQVQYRRVRAGNSYASQSESVVTVGLGDASSVDTVLVRWPSGQISVHVDVAADQTLTIVEPDA